MRKVVVLETNTALEASDAINQFISDNKKRYNLVNASTSVYVINGRTWYCSTVVYDEHEYAN